jgi:hypothetical protein
LPGDGPCSSSQCGWYLNRHLQGLLNIWQPHFPSYMTPRRKGVMHWWQLLAASFCRSTLILPRVSQETVQGFTVLLIGPGDFKGGLLIKFRSLWHRCLSILNKGWVLPDGPFFWLQREKWTKEKWNRRNCISLAWCGHSDTCHAGRNGHTFLQKGDPDPEEGPWHVMVIDLSVCTAETKRLGRRKGSGRNSNPDSSAEKSPVHLEWCVATW